MRGIFSVIFFSLFSGLSAAASDDVIPKGGAPFCQSKDDLQEYLVAMRKGDKAWMNSLTVCGVLREGLKLGIIEQVSPDNEIGRVVRSRVFVPKVGSSIGFVFLLKTQ